MKQNNKIFKIIFSLLTITAMVLLTITAMVNATTISNSLSTFTGIIDMGTQQIYNITNVNTTNIYATTVNTTNLWIGATKVNSSNLLPLACANNSVGKYDTATGTWLCQSDTDTDTWYNVTSVQVTGTGTKTLNVEQLGGIANRTTSWTDIDTDTDTTINVTSIQVTGTTSKILTLEQLFGIANRTASWTDIDTDTTYSNGTGLNLTGTTFYLDLNYVDGVYVKRNTWTSIDNYPTGCSAGQYISTIGDTLTCSSPSGNPTYNVTSIQVTGTTTKTITLEQLGLTNLTATFTDIDIDTDTNTNDNVTAIQFTGTGTKTLTLQQSGGNTNLTATFTDIDTDTDTNTNVTSIQVTGTTTKTLNLEQPNLANLTASWTDIDTDTNANTLCSGTTTYLDGEGNCDDVSSVYYDSEADLTGLLNDNYVDVAGDSMTGQLNMGANNLTFTQGKGIVLNGTQSYLNIDFNSSGCVVIKGASSTLAVC